MQNWIGTGIWIVMGGVMGRAAGFATPMTPIYRWGGRGLI